MKTMFSFFISIVLLQITAFCLVHPEAKSQKLATLYLLLIVTVLYILAQFPLAFMSLNYSNSIARIKKITSQLTLQEIDELFSPSSEIADKPIEHIETNRVILLKDIGVNAIKDGDWLLPQHIMGSFADRVRANSSSGEEVFRKEIDSFLFMLNHFKRVALKNHDHQTISVIYRYYLSLYHVLISKKKIAFPFSVIDYYFLQLIHDIIASKDYPTLRRSIIKDFIGVILGSLQSLNYSDEELPTSCSLYRGIYKDRDQKLRVPEAVTFWSYLTFDQINLLLDILKFSFENKDGVVYKYFNWSIHRLFDKAKILNLTASQRESYFRDIFYKLEQISYDAIDYGVYDHIDIVSIHTVEDWIKEENDRLFYPALFYYSRALKKLTKKGKMDIILLDEFFMIGRATASIDIKSEIKTGVIKFIFDTAFALFKIKYDSDAIKYELQKQVNWLYSIVEKEASLASFSLQYKVLVVDMCKDYDYSKFPDYVD